MGIDCESREDLVFTCCRVAFDIVKTNVAGIHQPLLVSLLDIADQFRRVKVATVGDKRIPDVGPLPHQLATEQAREVGYDLFTALLPGGDQRHETAQRRTPGPLVGVLILDDGLDSLQFAATHRRQDLAQVFRDEVGAERIQEVARKRRQPDHKRVSASLPELRQ